MTTDTATLTLTRRFIAKTDAGTAIAAALTSVNAAVIVLGNPDQYLADLVQRLGTTRLPKKSGGTQAIPKHMKVAAVEIGLAIDPLTGETLSPATACASLSMLYGDAVRVAVLKLDGAAPELVVVLEAPDGTLRARRHLDPTWRPAPEVGEAGGLPTHQRADGEDRVPRECACSPTKRDTRAICVTVPLVYAEDAEELAATIAERSDVTSAPMPGRGLVAAKRVPAIVSEPRIAPSPRLAETRPRALGSEPIEPLPSTADSVAQSCSEGDHRPPVLGPRQRRIDHWIPDRPRHGDDGPDRRGIFRPPDRRIQQSGRDRTVSHGFRSGGGLRLPQSNPGTLAVLLDQDDAGLFQHGPHLLDRADPGILTLLEAVDRVRADIGLAGEILGRPPQGCSRHAAMNRRHKGHLSPFAVDRKPLLHQTVMVTFTPFLAVNAPHKAGHISGWPPRVVPSLPCAQSYSGVFQFRELSSLGSPLALSSRNMRRGQG